MYLDLFSEESRQSLHFGRFDCTSIDAFLAISGPLDVNFFLGEHTPGSQIRAPLSTLLRGLWLSTLASSISNAVPHPWKHLQYGYPVLYRQFQNHDLAWRTCAICSQKASARQARGKRRAFPCGACLKPLTQLFLLLTWKTRTNNYYACSAG